MRRSRRCRPSPTRSRSSRSTTARRTARRPSPTPSPPPIPASFAPSTTRRTSAMARPFARASRPPATTSSRSPTATASSRSPTSRRLTARLAEADQPDVVVGFRIKRADPLVRTLYARAYRLANRIFFGLKVTDVDCACKLFRREALDGPARRIRRRLLLGRDDHQAAGGRPDRRRGGRAPLPANGRVGDRREPAGRPPRGPRLLVAAPADVGESIARDAPRRADDRSPIA